MSQILPSPKDKLDPLSSKDVYKSLCTCGVVNIGETEILRKPFLLKTLVLIKIFEKLELLE